VELLESPEWAQVCAGLAVLTGRRSSELLSTAKFEKCSQWSVTFTGALKRRGELQELSFEIPTLTTADRVVKALENVRSRLPEAMQLSAEGVNRKYGQAIIRACDQHFAGLVPLREGKDTLYTHLFRAVYATIATFWYCPPQVNETEFRAAIQGHYAILDETDSTLRRELAASRHYADYEMADSVIARFGGKRKGIKLGHGGVKPLGVFEKGTVQSATTIRAEPKHRSSLRIWREDYDALTQVLDRFEGKTQQDKVANWIVWSLVQWQSQAIEEIEQEPQESEEIQSEEIQSEEIQSDGIPTALETKIDTLVGAIAQLVNLQTQVLAAPIAITPVPTKQKTSVPQPVEEEGKKKEQATGKYRARGQNQELIDQAIHAIMQHNDQAQTHDDKWAITINGLKGLGIKSQHAITKGLDARAKEIEGHHHKHQIDPTKHNLRHRGKSKIQQVIKTGE
jgi:Telomere resolvase